MKAAFFARLRALLVVSLTLAAGFCGNGLQAGEGFSLKLDFQANGMEEPLELSFPAVSKWDPYGTFPILVDDKVLVGSFRLDSGEDNAYPILDLEIEVPEMKLAGKEGAESPLTVLELMTPFEWGAKTVAMESEMLTISFTASEFDLPDAEKRPATGEKGETAGQKTELTPEEIQKLEIEIELNGSEIRAKIYNPTEHILGSFLVRVRYDSKEGKPINRLYPLREEIYPMGDELVRTHTLLPQPKDATEPEFVLERVLLRR